MDPLILVVRALGAQLIVWHHFALYGPMSDVAHPLAQVPLDWLEEYARIAVQAFLVMGGFLASRVLVTPVEGPPLPALRRRYLRLARPYWIALTLALLAAWAARQLIHDPSVPDAPTAWQVMANALMLQDIVGVDALSAGVWYVAIDLQLYGTLLVIAWICGCGPDGMPTPAARTAVLGLALLSLLWIGRDARLDMWAPYFFGSYGLGIIASWARSEPARRWMWRLVVLALAGVALWAQWRVRIAVAGCVAMALSFDLRRLSLPARSRLGSALRQSAEISYELFLLHYPVCLVVGAVVFTLFPTSAPANAAGLLAAWGLSILAARALHRYTSRP